MLINWLAGATKWTNPGGTIYVGPSPFDWDKGGDEKNTIYRPWVIDHEGMRDKLWRCIEIESFFDQIRKGNPIGVKVTLWSLECN